MMMEVDEDRAAGIAGRDRFAAVALAGGAVVTLALLLHHPVLSAAQRENFTSIRAGMQGLASPNRIVHGLLLLVIAIQAIGFHRVAARLGLGRPAALGGFLAYFAAALVMVIPATLDGFVTSDLAGVCVGAAPGCAIAQMPVLHLVAVAIQDFTKVALVGLALAMLCFAAALLRSGGVARRLVGLLGIMLGVGSLLALLTSRIMLDPHSLAALWLAQMAWNLALAAIMARPGAWRDRD